MRKQLVKKPYVACARSHKPLPRYVVTDSIPPQQRKQHGVERLRVLQLLVQKYLPHRYQIPSDLVYRVPKPQQRQMYLLAAKVVKPLQPRYVPSRAQRPQPTPLRLNQQLMLHMARRTRHRRTRAIQFAPNQVRVRLFPRQRHLVVPVVNETRKKRCRRNKPRPSRKVVPQVLKVYASQLPIPLHMARHAAPLQPRLWQHHKV